MNVVTDAVTLSDGAVPVRSTVSGLPVSELLQQPVSSLLGVDDAAAAALEPLGIRTIFDLGASELFAHASRVAGAGAPGAPSARWGVVPADWLVDAAQGPPDRVSEQSLEQLRGLTGEQAATLADALSVSTIGELAHWPPYTVSRALVGDATGAVAADDDDQAEELRPRTGQYPTERVYYSTLILLDAPLGDAGRDELSGPLALDTDGEQALALPAVGALCTFSQSWYLRGVTLGHLLHSLALAPGENTRIAVIDWTRRTAASEAEQIAEGQQIDESTAHSRAISEVQQAVATELQQGGSTSTSTSTTQSSSGAAALGTGLLGSLFGSADVSGSQQAASTQAWGTSSSWTRGNRSVTASLSQSVNDRTEQHASEVRNRRATAVREVSQAEHEQLSTRIVANYNHMHALTVQYYEVVQVYESVVDLREAHRCLFVPIEVIDFASDRGRRLIARFRAVLASGALMSDVRSMLADTATAVEIRPGVPTAAPGVMAPYAPGGLIPPAGGQQGQQPADPAPGTTPLVFPPWYQPPPFIPPLLFGRFAWDAAEVSSAAAVLQRALLRPGSSSLWVPDDVQLLGFSIAGGGPPVRVELDLDGADPMTIDLTAGQSHATLDVALPLGQVTGISVTPSPAGGPDGTITLECAYYGRRFSLPHLPFPGQTGGTAVSIASLQSERADREAVLVAHLNEHREYYSRLIYGSLDATSLGLILARYDWNGGPLIAQVEPRPVGFAGNYMVLRAPAGADEASGIAGDDGTSRKWGEILADYALTADAQQDSRLVPIPTNGVFAEAVLGRSNAAEKLDITRFWNWQDSPIPLVAPDIAALDSGSRATPEDIKPGGFSSPSITVTAPSAVPDPAGLAAVLATVSRGDMFRDMSGLGGLQKLIEGVAQGTVTAADAAGQLASDNMRTEAQKAVEMGKTVADLAKTAIAAATGMPTSAGSGGGGSGSSISATGARINQGRDMDQRGVPVPQSVQRSPVASGTPAAGGSAASSGAQAPAAAGAVSANGAGTTAFSREGAYADQANFGYSPDIVRAAVDGLATTSQPLDGAAIEEAGFFTGTTDVAPATVIADWGALVQFKVPSSVVAALEARQLHVQDIADAMGPLFVDDYGVRITDMPTIDGVKVDAAGLAQKLRLNLPNLVDRSNTIFAPYDMGTDDVKWTSDDPVGTVFFLDIIGPDNASVVCSFAEPSRWRFSTLTASQAAGRPGAHPVSGNREFGVEPEADGTLRAYTRGADRTGGILDLAPIVALGQRKLWASFQQGVSAYVLAHGGACTIETPKRLQTDWSGVLAALGQGTLI